VGTNRRRDWGLYAAAAVLAVYAHLFALLVLGAQALAAGLALRRSSSPRTRPFAVLVLIAVGLVPLGLAVALGGQGEQIDWLREPRLIELPGVLDWLAESRIVLAVYGFGAITAFVMSPRRWPLVLLTAWLALPPILAFAVSLVKPVFLDRYFLVCLPALVLLAGAGLARLRLGWVAWALVAAAVVFSIRAVDECGTCKVRNDDWRGATEYVSDRARPGDKIFFYPAELRTPFVHYVGEAPANLQLAYPGTWALENHVDGNPGAAVDAAGGRVWLVTWWLPSQDVREELSRRGRLVEDRRFGGDVRVELYEISKMDVSSNRSTSTGEPNLSSASLGSARTTFSG
jgi:mannosyltransferase